MLTHLLGGEKAHILEQCFKSGICVLVLACEMIIGGKHMNSLLC